MKALIIDDAADVRLYVRALLGSWGYQAADASDAEDGFALIASSDIQIVICDWMMPNMTGPELCRVVRGAELGHYVYFILLTARSDKADLLEAMEAGADDFLSKPFDARVLRARLRVAERILGLEARLAEQNRELRDSTNRLEQAYGQIRCDLAAAARIQQQMLPRSRGIAAPFRAEWLFLPAAEVSGDNFNLFALTPERVGFFLLDVSGHGIPAALLSARLSCSLVPAGGEALASELGQVGPAAFLSGLNQQLTDPDAEVENYATIVYGVLDKRDGSAEIVLAGHPPPLVLRCSGGFDDLPSGGLPFGMFPEVAYESRRLRLEQGDKLILYSDGVTECRGTDGELFGEQRFRDFVARFRGADPGQLTKDLGDHLRRWHGGADFDDDISVMVLERRSDA